MRSTTALLRNWATCRQNTSPRLPVEAVQRSRCHRTIYTSSVIMSKHPPFKEVEASRPDFEAGYKPHFTKVPETDFKAGGGLNTLPYAGDFEPEGKFKTIEPEKEAKGDIYKILISAITPRPIAFVSSQSADGHSNLAPFSYFNMVAHDPPTIMVSIQSQSDKYPDGTKDTNHNIKETEEFSVSIISEPFLEASNYTSIDAPNDVDEWQLAGLTRRQSETIKPPHVAESAFSVECKLLHWYDVIGSNGKPSNSVILGRITRIHVKEAVLDPNSRLVLPEKLRPVSRLGGITYGRSNQFVEIPRPVWAKVKDEEDVKDALSSPPKKI